MVKIVFVPSDLDQHHDDGNGQQDMNESIHRVASQQSQPHRIKKSQTRSKACPTPSQCSKIECLLLVTNPVINSPTRWSCIATLEVRLSRGRKYCPSASLSNPNQHIEDLVPGNRRKPRNDAQKPRTIRFTATAMRHTTQPRRSHRATRKGRSGTTKAATPPAAQHDSDVAHRHQASSTIAKDPRQGARSATAQCAGLPPLPPRLSGVRLIG